MSIRDLIVIVVALEFGLHYFPWRLLIRRKLPRLAAYTLGLLGMMGPYTVWLMDRGEVEMVQTLWMVIIAAGGTVFALYGLDRYLDNERVRAEAAQRERIMQSMLKDKGDGTANQA